MKLRNKNTGEIIDLDIANIKAQFGVISVIPEPVKLGGDEFVYHSLAELNQEWEDYKPTEPLIKDKKVRKAIRAWAEACFIETVEYDEYWVSFRRDDKTISFKDEDGCLGFYELENSRDYTIDELCGEEEE